MVWNVNSPDGAKSVKQNTIPMQQNTAYLLSTQQKDHFFNEGADEDGHHKWAQMVATNDADKSLQTNASLATGMDLVYFSRFMTASETNSVITAQNTQAFVVSQNSTTPNPAVLQLLGIRACCLFNVSGGVVTMLYRFNVSGIVRDSPGKFRANFTNNLPTENYSVLGGCVNTTENNGYIFIMRPSSTINAAKNVSQIRFYNQDTRSTDTQLDPLQCWFVCFGG